MSSDSTSPRTSSPTGRGGRRVALLLGVPVLILAILLGGAILFRVDIAHAVLKNRLDAFGIGEARFRVERVTDRSLVIVHFSAGGALSFDRLAVGYTLSSILRGRIAHVALAGLWIDLTQPGPWAALPRGDDSGGWEIDPRLLPTIDMTQARIKLAGPVGAMTVAADMTLNPASNGTLTIEATASAAGSPGTVDLTLDGSIETGAAGGASAIGQLRLASRDMAIGQSVIGALTVDLPMRIEVGSAKADILIQEGGRLAADGLRLAKDGPATDVSTKLSGRIGLSQTAAGIAVDHALTILPAPATLSGAKAYQIALGRMRATGTLSAASAYSGDLKIDRARLARGDMAVAMEELVVRLTTESEFAAPGAGVTVNAIRDVSAAPAPGSYSLVATARREGDGIAFKAGIGGLGIQKLATVNGVHDGGRQAGYVALSIPELSIGPDGLRLGTVLPVLAAVRNLAGTVGGDARLDWRGARLDGQATLRLAGIGGETDNGAVEGLGGTIVFDGLLPPRTASGQILRIRKITAGAVLSNASIRFALLPTGILRIDRADAALADGRIVLVAPAIDLATQKARATVTLEDVRLEQLLGLAAPGDIHATGRVHGSIPLRIDGTTVAVDRGALAARGGGVLRFRSERAKQALQSGGEQVAQMLQALENFSYERLSVEIDKSPAGEATVTLRTLGHNPSVLNGRKFQININLETNLDRILDAVLQWYRLSGKALRDIVKP